LLRDLLHVHKDFSHSQLVGRDAASQLLHVTWKYTPEDETRQSRTVKTGKAGQAKQAKQASHIKPAKAEQRQSKSRAKARQDKIEMRIQVCEAGRIVTTEDSTEML
jgi:hypothetical protein